MHRSIKAAIQRQRPATAIYLPGPPSFYSPADLGPWLGEVENTHSHTPTHTPPCVTPNNRNRLPPWVRHSSKTPAQTAGSSKSLVARAWESFPTRSPRTLSGMSQTHTSLSAPSVVLPLLCAAAPRRRVGRSRAGTKTLTFFFSLPAQDICSEQPAGGGMLSPQHRQEGDGYHKQVSGQDAHPSLNPRLPPPPPHHVGGTGDAAMSSAPAISQVFAGASRDGG